MAHTSPSSGSDMSHSPEVEDVPGAHLAGRSSGSNRVCVQCGRKQTPQWREGPQGPKTLCNACGVRHSRAMKRQCALPKQAATPKGTSPSEHPGEGVPRKPRTKRPSSVLRDDFVFNSSEDPTTGLLGDDADERKAAQELLHFASLAAGSASEDGDGLVTDEGGIADDTILQPNSSRRSNRKRQRSSRLSDPADVVRPNPAAVATRPIGLPIMRPTVTAARFLAARPSEDMHVHLPAWPAVASGPQQGQLAAPAGGVLLARSVASQASADHSSDCEELATAGMGSILSQLPISVLSASERQQLSQLQQAAAAAQALAERTEAERKETLKHLMQKQAEAHQARVRLQQEACRLEREVQTARTYLTAAASAGIMSLLLGSGGAGGHHPAPPPGSGAAQAPPGAMCI